MSDVKKVWLHRDDFKCAETFRVILRTLGYSHVEFTEEIEIEVNVGWSPEKPKTP